MFICQFGVLVQFPPFGHDTQGSSWIETTDGFKFRKHSGRRSKGVVRTCLSNKYDSGIAWKHPFTIGDKIDHGNSRLSPHVQFFVCRVETFEHVNVRRYSSDVGRRVGGVKVRWFFGSWKGLYARTTRYINKTRINKQGLPFDCLCIYRLLEVFTYPTNQSIFYDDIDFSGRAISCKYRGILNGIGSRDSFPPRRITLCDSSKNKEVGSRHHE